MTKSVSCVVNVGKMAFRINRNPSFLLLMVLIMECCIVGSLINNVVNLGSCPMLKSCVFH